MKRFLVVILLVIFSVNCFAQQKIKREFLEFKSSGEYVNIKTDLSVDLYHFFQEKSNSGKLYRFIPKYILKNLPDELGKFTFYTTDEPCTHIKIGNIVCSGVTITSGYNYTIIIEYNKNKWSPYGAYEGNWMPHATPRPNTHIAALCAELGLTMSDKFLIHEMAHAYDYISYVYGYPSNTRSDFLNAEGERKMEHDDGWKEAVEIIIRSMHRELDDDEELMELLIDDIIREY